MNIPQENRHVKEIRDKRKKWKKMLQRIPVRYINTNEKDIFC